MFCSKFSRIDKIDFLAIDNKCGSIFDVYNSGMEVTGIEGLELSLLHTEINMVLLAEVQSKVEQAL